MGLFSNSNYEKEGPGVYMDDLPKSGIKLFFYVLLNRFWKLVGLNILFLLFSLPIITLPAAIVAQSKVVCELMELSYVQLLGDFWRAFKESFLESLGYGAITAMLILSGYAANIYYLHIIEGWFAVVCMGAVVAVLFVWSMMLLYIPIMIGTVNLSFKHIISNSFRLVFIKFFRNLLSWIIVAALFATAGYTYPASLILIFFLLPALMGLLICFNSWPVIKQYVLLQALDDTGNE